MPQFKLQTKIFPTNTPRVLHVETTWKQGVFVVFNINMSYV